MFYAMKSLIQKNIIFSSINGKWPVLQIKTIELYKAKL